MILKRWVETETLPGLVLRESSSPTFYDGILLAGFANGKLIALDPKTGKKLWEKQIASPPDYKTPVASMIDVDTTPKAMNDVVFAASYQGDINALHVNNGWPLWTHRLSTFTGLSIGKTDIFVTDAGGNVWAFNRKTGIVAWRQSHLLNRQLTAPVTMGENAVVGDGRGYMHWLAQNDGQFVARVNVGERLLANPIVSGNRVFAYTDDGRLAAFEVVPLG